MAESQQQLTPEEIRDRHLKQHGTQIANSLLDLHESYNELESDPGLFDLLISDLGEISH